MARTEELHARISRALDDVVSLDHDRILRSYLTVLEATLRTNYFQVDADGRTKPYISFKIRPDKIPDLPQPRPSSRSSSTRRASRACTCASARSPVVACAGPTAATTSAPRCSAWSRRRW